MDVMLRPDLWQIRWLWSWDLVVRSGLGSRQSDAGVSWYSEILSSYSCSSKQETCLDLDAFPMFSVPLLHLKSTLTSNLWREELVEMRRLGAQSVTKFIDMQDVGGQLLGPWFEYLVLGVEKVKILFDQIGRVHWIWQCEHRGCDWNLLAPHWKQCPNKWAFPVCQRSCWESLWTRTGVGWIFYSLQYSVEPQPNLDEHDLQSCFQTDISWLQEIRASKFDQRPLHPPQQRYAALDAWILVKMLSSCNADWLARTNKGR